MVFKFRYGGVLNRLFMLANYGRVDIKEITESFILFFVFFFFVFLTFSREAHSVRELTVQKHFAVVRSFLSVVRTISQPVSHP